MRDLQRDIKEIDDNRGRIFCTSTTTAKEWLERAISAEAELSRLQREVAQLAIESI
jgi:hypothetical protein